MPFYTSEDNLSVKTLPTETLLKKEMIHSCSHNPNKGNKKTMLR